MRKFLALGLTALLLASWGGSVARAQPRSGGPRIEWEVKSRFRLFRGEADFQRHVAADRGDGLLAAEDRLERESDGRGWPLPSSNSQAQPVFAGTTPPSRRPTRWSRGAR